MSSTFNKFLKIVEISPDSRDYYDILEEHPEFVNQQDKDGRTALMHAAMSGFGDSMETLIDSYNADVTIRDKDGKTVYDHAKEWYAKNPEEYNNDASIPAYFLKVIRNADPKFQGAKDVAALQQTSKISNIPVELNVASYLTGEKGTLPAQVSKVRSKYAGLRKTYKRTRTLKKNKKTRGRRVQRRERSKIQ